MSNKNFESFIEHLSDTDETKAIGKKILSTNSALLKAKNPDPYDPKLDPATRVDIYAECMSNPWYFFREVYKVYRNGEWGSLLATYNTLGAISAIEQGKNFLSVSQARTTLGILTMMRHTYPMIFSADCNQVIFVPSSEAALVLTRRFSEVIAQLPDYIVGDIKVDEDQSVDKPDFVMRVFNNKARSNKLTVVYLKDERDVVSKFGYMNASDVVTFDNAQHIQHYPMLRSAISAGRYRKYESKDRRGEMGFGFNFVHAHFAVDDGFPGHEAHWRDLKVVESFMVPFRLRYIIEPDTRREGYALYDYHLSREMMDVLTGNEQDIGDDLY